MATGHDPRRRGLARMTARLFGQQTYPNCELLIINQGDRRLFSDEPTPARTHEVLAGAGLFVGQLRNLAWDISQADYLICWDDDDFHHPTRIEYQMLRCSGHPVIMRHELIFNAHSGESIHSRRGDGYENTMLWPRACLARYSDKRRGSDTQFRHQLRKEYRILTMIDNPPHLYIRVHHGLNLWDWGHFRRLPKAAAGLSLEDAVHLSSIRPLYKIALKDTE